MFLSKKLIIQTSVILKQNLKEEQQTPKQYLIYLKLFVNNMTTNYKNNFIEDNAIYIHGLFDDSIIELLPQIKNLIQKQKNLKNGKIIFDINSRGGDARELISLINLIEKAKK